MKNKKIIFILVLAVIAVAAVFGLSKKGQNGYETVIVARQNVVDEVSESGTIKVGEQINLSFKSQEGLKEVYVKVGDKVLSGQKLATINTSRLYYQLNQARASLASYQAQYQKLLAGPTAEELKISQTAAENARNAFESAKQNLTDIEAVAGQSLDSAYGDALNVLDDSYLKAYAGLTTIDTVLQSYFITRNDQASVIVKNNRNLIGDDVNNIKALTDSVKNNPANENVDSSLAQTRISLGRILSSLSVIRQSCEDPLYVNSVSSTDKTALDTQKTGVNTGLANLINAEQAIASAKTTNAYNINTAQTQLIAAQGASTKAEEEFSKLKAPARIEDVDYYQAQVSQGEAQVNLLIVQIGEATLKSPVDGQVVAISKRAGEVVSPGEAIIGLLPNDPFEITVNIYEEDIVKVKIDNPVEIKLTAFPGVIFAGKVISIEPSEKMVNDVVYYKTTIGFNDPPDGLRPGMTADVSIKTAERKDVLALPLKAIQKKETKETVMVLEGETAIEKEVQTGLKGSDSLVEIVSGISQGETVIISNNKK